MQILITEIRHSGTLWLYAAVTAVGFFFIMAFVPETRGKTEAEISAFFLTRTQREREEERRRRSAEKE